MTQPKSFKSNFLAAAAVATAAALAAGAGAPAWAGAGVITTEVKPLSTSVTYSIAGSSTVAALTTWIGYTVSISNTGGNTINAVRFTGGTSVTDPAESALYSSVEGTSACTPVGTTKIECQLGQLRAGESVPTFAVFFKTPVKVTNNVVDLNGEDSVKFSGITYYAEGTGGPNSIPQNSTVIWASTPVALGTGSPLLVKSSVPKAGGTFFTGAGGVSKSDDKFATTVTIPSSAKYTTAEIEESIFTTGCVSFIACYTSKITIPLPAGTISFSPYLTIVLRQDKLNIVKGTKIGSVVVKYTDGANIYIVGACQSGPMPRSDGIPCIAESKYYKDSRVAGWTVDLDGDFEWTLINLHNGSFDLF